jgi:hypothetical protein
VHCSLCSTQLPTSNRHSNYNSHYQILNYIPIQSKFNKPPIRLRLAIQERHYEILEYVIPSNITSQASDDSSSNWHSQNTNTSTLDSTAIDNDGFDDDLENREEFEDVNQQRSNSTSATSGNEDTSTTKNPQARSISDIDYNSSYLSKLLEKLRSGVLNSAIEKGQLWYYRKNPAMEIKKDILNGKAPNPGHYYLPEKCFFFHPRLTWPEIK